MKILILNLCCNSSDFREVISTQKNTWDLVPHADVRTIYYYGGYRNVTLNGNDLYLNSPDGPMDMFQKTIEAFKISLDFDYDFVFRISNSNYINKEELHKLLLDKPRRKYLGGTFHNKFIQGCGFAITKDMVELLVKNNTKDFPTTVDDLEITNQLKKVPGIIIQGDLPRYDFYAKPGTEISIVHNYRCRVPELSRKKDVEAMLALQEFYK
jgi:hypothetical protein